MHTTQTKNLLTSYLKQINNYDEVIDNKGNVKPHWKSLFDTIHQIGLAEFGNRQQEIIKRLRENGVTYNVYGVTDGNNRQWQLDPIPFLITRTEWAGITQGLIQRAELLDLILKDIYGPQHLLKDKIIPPELVYANTGFSRAANDVKIKSNHQLLISATDMARGPDGRMWVLDSRTQTPSGFGYAFENRKILSRIIPELAHNLYVDRISPFFYNLQKSFYKLSPSGKDQPFVVFLTPGPKNETYFEQSYLASYLGCTLVQGDDLLVRDGYVWLKSIGGLQKVDVIVRRVDDDFVDPLELKQNSRLGIPGLLQVLRKGNVLVINPPGIGLLENHAFLAFGNSISNYFLGQDLILPSVATWWCGQSKELAFTLEHLDRLIIKKVNRKQKFRSVYGRLLSAQEKESVRRMILQNPMEYVAQEEVQLSTTPSFFGNHIEPRLAAIRGFVLSDGEQFFPMQGGLTRNSPEKDRFLISNQYGGQSKDTWIVSDTPEQDQEKIHLSSSPANVRDNVLSSRAAENLYWTGRYCERINILTKIIANLINEVSTYKKFSDGDQEEHIHVLLRSITHLTATYPGFLEMETEDNAAGVYKELMDLITNPNKPGSVAFNIDNYIRATLNIRERLTIGTFKVVDDIDEHNTILKTQKNLSITEALHQLEQINNKVFTFYGIVNETMTRDSGMILFEIGKLLERCQSLVSQLRSCVCFKLSEPVEEETLKTLLHNNFSLIRYRSKFKSEARIESFLDMILYEVKLPHSVTNQLNRLSECINSLPNTTIGARMNDAQKVLLEAIALLYRSNLTELYAYDTKTLYREKLDEMLTTLGAHLNNISLAISNIYFTHAILMESFVRPTEDVINDEI